MPMTASGAAAGAGTIVNRRFGPQRCDPGLSTSETTRNTHRGQEDLLGRSVRAEALDDRGVHLLDDRLAGHGGAVREHGDDEVAIGVERQ